jgi:hypothetical protein
MPEQTIAGKDPYYTKLQKDAYNMERLYLDLHICVTVNERQDARKSSR